MTQTEIWTVGKLLTWTTDYLKKKGSDSARLDAEVLLAHARQCQRIELYTAFNDEPDETVKTAFREMVVRRAEGTPVAYLVGHKEFYSLDFRVNSDCLIPRPETEHLVVAALDAAKAIAKSRNQSPSNEALLVVADVCTGSGCIAITVAKHLPHAKLFACDLSAAALKVASSNAVQHKVEERVTFLEGDLLEAVPLDMNASSELFDMILSNPPYISQTEYDALSKTVREHEPKTALLSAPSGLEISARLVEQASSRLKPGGYLIIETSPMLAGKLSELLNEERGWSLQPTVKDLQGHARIVVAIRKQQQ